MNKRQIIYCISLVCFVAVITLCGCESSENTDVPFQPANPYFYSVHTPFDIVRAWIDALLR